MADGLVAWLRDQLDADESAARKLLRDTQDVRLALRDPLLLGRRVPGWYLWPDVERTLTRTLADIDIKRAVVDLRDAMAAGVEAANGTILSGAAKVRLGAYDNTIRLIASAYADRSGYRDEWRPS